jgi:probable phosphoglycerate mutase
MLLVRHGQSEWNADGRWQGQADPPLSELGLRQAADAARAIGTVDAIVASPLERAQRTAEIIASALGMEPVLIIDGLMERSAGEWEGLTRAQIDERYPSYLADGRRPPGWESDDELLARVLGALDAVHHVCPGGEVVAVTHGGVIMNLERHLGDDRGRIANVGGRWIVRRGADWALGERLELVDPSERTVPNQI